MEKILTVLFSSSFCEQFSSDLPLVVTGGGRSVPLSVFEHMVQADHNGNEQVFLNSLEFSTLLHFFFSVTQSNTY